MTKSYLRSIIFCKVPCDRQTGLVHKRRHENENSSSRHFLRAIAGNRSRNFSSSPSVVPPARWNLAFAVAARGYKFTRRIYTSDMCKYFTRTCARRGIWNSFICIVQVARLSGTADCDRVSQCFIGFVNTREGDINREIVGHSVYSDETRRE